jgi:hypothetical protein
LAEPLLLELDLRDYQAIVDFANTFGVLGVNDPFREWPFFEGLSDLDGGIPWGLRRFREDVADVIRRREHAQAQFVAAFLEIGPPAADEGLYTECETLPEFIVGAKYIRDAARLWIAIRGGADIRSTSLNRR